MACKELTGKTALVTGASRGLGRAIALGLGESGARVVLVARDQASLERTAAAITAVGGESAVFRADVSQETEVLTLEKAVAARCGRVDILVNNAGINVRKPIAEFTLEEWNRVMNTNVTGVFLMCRSFVPQMKGQGYGRILNLTSMMSHVALPGRTAYAASKTALMGLTKALALELAGDNITVNGISPGFCATEMNRSLLEDPEFSTFFLSRIPVGRWGRPEEIAALAVYLCSAAAGFITGTDVVIDGGWTAQ